MLKDTVMSAELPKGSHKQPVAQPFSQSNPDLATLMSSASLRSTPTLNSLHTWGDQPARPGLEVIKALARDLQTLYFSNAAVEGKVDFKAMRKLDQYHDIKNTATELQVRCTPYCTAVLPNDRSYRHSLFLTT